MFYIYVLQSASRSLPYIGYTADLRKRVAAHNAHKTTSTARAAPWKLLYYEAFSSEQQARDREKKLKQRGRAWQELKRRIAG